jgi:hypothetical protein
LSSVECGNVEATSLDEDRADEAEAAAESLPPLAPSNVSRLPTKLS